MSDPDARKLYVSCLAAYNQGHLHGAWVTLDGDGDVDAVCEAIRAMLAQSRPVPHAEEWAVHDSEGWGDFEVGEYPNLDHLVAVDALIEDHGGLVTTYWDRVRCEVDELGQQFSESYVGTYASLSAWGQEVLDEVYGSAIPEGLRGYINYGAWARDAELSGDVWTHAAEEGGVHVFRTR